jgi:diadenosine tetraphosphate (Ap4A) HIT family hydrolase
MFELHPRLDQDCIQLGRFELCRLLLMNESRYPWFILVPELPGLTEIFQLVPADQVRLIGESSRLASALLPGFVGDKMNIAAIGNLVPQLHVHHVVRKRDDAAWPGPIWGRFEPLAYDAEGLARVVGILRAHAPEGLSWFGP